MAVYSVAALLAFLVLAAALFVRIVLMTVDREFRDLALAAADPDRRRDELARMDGRLRSLLPVPEDAEPLPKPGAGLARLAAVALLTLGVILLWGGLFAPPGERRTWLVAGGLSAAASVCFMRASLSRRRRGRVARLLRTRADLRRLDGDVSGSADDLEQLLRLTPWDDVAWSELAEARRDLGDDGSALAAWERASVLDPDYGDYRAAAAGAALRLGRFGEAERLVAGWERRVAASNRDPAALAVAYRSAILLAEGDGAGARILFRRALQLDPGAVKAALDLNPDLAPLAGFEETYAMRGEADAAPL